MTRNTDHLIHDFLWIYSFWDKKWSMNSMDMRKNLPVHCVNTYPLGWHFFYENKILNCIHISVQEKFTKQSHYSHIHIHKKIVLWKKFENILFQAFHPIVAYNLVRNQIDITLCCWRISICKASPRWSIVGSAWYTYAAALGYYRSGNFKMSFWYHRFDQKTNKFFLRISALASKKRSNQKNKGTLLY